MEMEKSREVEAAAAAFLNRPWKAIVVVEEVRGWRSILAVEARTEVVVLLSISMSVRI